MQINNRDNSYQKKSRIKVIYRRRGTVELKYIEQNEITQQNKNNMLNDADIPVVPIYFAGHV
jgi:hypothetical protein